MTFQEFLSRYHISPLSYYDGRVLEDDDYKVLLKYLTIWSFIINGPKSILSEEDLKSMDANSRNAIIPYTPEERIDILMNKTGEQVL